MQFSFLHLLFAFSIKSTIASPVGDDFSLEQLNGARNPVNLDISKESTNPPPTDTDYLQSTSQFPATNLNADTSVLEPMIENPIKTPPQPYGDYSAKLGTNILSFVSPLSQQPTVSDSNLADMDFFSQPSFLPSSLVAQKKPRPKPKCDPLRELYCCYGTTDPDESGGLIVDLCHECNNLVSFFPLLLSLSVLETRLFWGQL